MSRGLPSMTALLGLLAIAGYQNRDKLAEMFGGQDQGRVPDQDRARVPGGAGDGMLGNAGGQTGGLGGLLSGLGGASAGTVLSSGLGDLVERFRQNGRGDVADSWVARGPNKPVAPADLEQAIGPDILDNLTQQTGLSRQELLDRLSRNLPDAVDRYTPDGQIPRDDPSR